MARDGRPGRRDSLGAGAGNGPTAFRLPRTVRVPGGTFGFRCRVGPARRIEVDQVERAAQIGRGARVGTGRGGRRRPAWRARVALLAVGVAVMLVASGCQFIQLDTGGFLVTPDEPSGRR